MLEIFGYPGPGFVWAEDADIAALPLSDDSVRFDERLLTLLGYRPLRAGRMEEAIAAFELNVEAHPEAANPRDSLGDAYVAAGRLEDAKRTYQQAVDLAEQQGHQGLAAYRASLERVVRQLERQP